MAVANKVMAMKFIRSRAKLKGQTEARITRALAAKLNSGNETNDFHLAYYYVTKVWPKEENAIPLNKVRLNARKAETARKSRATKTVVVPDSVTDSDLIPAEAV